jgi:hypothetical protein
LRGGIGSKGESEHQGSDWLAKGSTLQIGSWLLMRWIEKVKLCERDRDLELKVLNQWGRNGGESD